MIANFATIAEGFGVSSASVSLAFAGVLTTLVILIHALARWFDDRDC